MPIVLAGPDIEGALAGIEAGLASLHQAVLTGETDGIDGEAAALQRALADWSSMMRNAHAGGGLAPGTRHTLAAASARLTARREALARASAATDRAMNILMADTPESRDVYSAQGMVSPRSSGGFAQA
jgi:hypothetical protein